MIPGDGTSECCTFYLFRQEDSLATRLETRLAFEGPELVPPQWVPKGSDESAVHHWMAGDE